MQHAFALNLTTVTSDLPVPSDCLDLPKHCHTSIIDGHRIDQATGEVYGKFVTSPYHPGTEQYQVGTARPSFASRQHLQPVIVGKIDNVVYVDFRATNSDDAVPNEIAPGANPKRAGRKPASTVNPIAHLAVELLTNDPGEQHPLWLDNIIFGSCLTAAGQSQNVCNVAMKKVVGALYLPEFRVDVLVAQGTPLRKAQRIIKAARHAAHGIQHYLVRRPKLLQSYEGAVKLEASLAYSPVCLVLYTPLREVPQHIKDMYTTGDYLAYGEALRAFRKGFN